MVAHSVTVRGPGHAVCVRDRRTPLILAAP
jgi:hypothetical protein